MTVHDPDGLLPGGLCFGHLAKLPKGHRSQETRGAAIAQVEQFRLVQLGKRQIKVFLPKVARCQQDMSAAAFLGTSRQDSRPVSSRLS